MINLQVPKSTALKPTITVIGVGGAGGNAVNNMIESNLEGVNFVAANTDAQALEYSKADHKIQLGMHITQGLGAGATPEVGRAAAEETVEEILEHLTGSNMVFVTAGMGGGTGTGAAPVIAKLAREQGILTVGVVTKPFHFEGKHRMKLAEQGLEELQRYVDTLIVIPNQNLFRLATDSTTFSQAFKMADNVLHAGVRGVTDLMVMPGLINLDFADIRTVMSEMGKAMMGTGEAEGDNRSIEAAEAAISNPLLDDISMKGARGVLINITGGPDMTLFEVDEAANRIREEVDPDANIIFGSTFADDLQGKIRVSVVATGIDSALTNASDYPTGSGSSSSSNTRYERPAAAPAQSAYQVEPKKVSATSASGRFIPQKPVEADDEYSSSSSNVANFPSEKVVSARQQFQPAPRNAQGQQQKKVKKGGFFERAARSFGFNEQEEETRQQRRPQQSTNEQNRARVKMDSEEDYYEIPAYMRRKSSSGE